jgi:hypothetical protein
MHCCTALGCCCCTCTQCGLHCPLHYATHILVVLHQSALAIMRHQSLVIGRQSLVSQQSSVHGVGVNSAAIITDHSSSSLIIHRSSLIINAHPSSAIGHQSALTQPNPWLQPNLAHCMSPLVMLLVIHRAANQSTESFIQPFAHFIAVLTL